MRHRFFEGLALFSLAVFGSIAVVVTAPAFAAVWLAGLASSRRRA